MFKTIFTHLKREGFDVYSIGQHNGTCTGPFVVIKENTPSMPNKAVYEEEIELLLYYPIGEYSRFKNYIENVKKSMKELKLRDNNLAIPIVTEDAKKAYTTFISYTNMRKKVF